MYGCFCLTFPADEFIKMLTAGLPGPFPALRWTNGVIFNFNVIQYQGKALDDVIEGVLHWDHVAFAPLPRYVDTLAVPNRPDVQITLLNVSNSETFVAIGKFLRKQLHKN